MENTEKKQKKALVLAGVPGSGKSTWVKNRLNSETDIHISRDNIRFSLLKDNQQYFEVENEVRDCFFRQIRNFTANDYPCECVYIDATHLNPKSRKQVLGAIRGDTYKIAVSFDTPLELALERNAQRTGRALVPDSVIHNMYHRYTKPILDEGFDEIWHILPNEKIIVKEVHNNE